MLSRVSLRALRFLRLPVNRRGAALLRKQAKLFPEAEVIYADKTDQPSESETRGYGRKPHFIRTLVPTELQESDFVDFRHTPKRARFQVPWMPEPLEFEISYARDGKDRVPFPPCTGAFYFHPEPEGQPAYFCDIRFRVAASPSAFDAGHDLLLPTGTPWSVDMVSVACVPGYRGLAALLLRERLVGPKLLEEFSVRRQRKTKTALGSLAVPATLGVPFSLNLALSTHTILLVNQDNRSARIRLHFLFVDARVSTKKLDSSRRNPYRGIATCCFEHSTLPEHAGTRTLVIRIVSISGLESVIPTYDEHVPIPVASSYVAVRQAGRNAVHRWACDVDRVMASDLKGLAMLFEPMRSNVRHSMSLRSSTLADLPKI